MSAYHPLYNVVPEYLRGTVDGLTEGMQTEISGADIRIQQDAGDLEGQLGLLPDEVLGERFRQLTVPVRDEHNNRILEAVVLHEVDSLLRRCLIAGVSTVKGLYYLHPAR